MRALYRAVRVVQSRYGLQRARLTTGSDAVGRGAAGNTPFPPGRSPPLGAAKLAVTFPQKSPCTRYDA